MLTLTEAAGRHLEELLTEANVPQGTYLRIALLDEGGSSLTLSREEPGDTRLEHQGKTVLVLDRRAAEGLAERTLDAEGPGKEERRLVLR